MRFPDAVFNLELGIVAVLCFASFCNSYKITARSVTCRSSINYSCSLPRNYPSASIGKLKMSSTIAVHDDGKNVKELSPRLSTLEWSATNLLKNAVGAGVFSISSKIISVSADRSTISKGILLIAMMGMWATYNFWILGETCAMTSSKTYGESWANTVSKKSEWIVQMVVTLSPIVSSLANTIVLTDILGMLLRNVGFPIWLYGNRNLVIFLLGAFILYPLCTLRDLSALGSVSVAGLLGQLVAMLALGVRLLDQSYRPGGAYFLDAFRGLTPKFELSAFPSTPVNPMSWFVFASLLSYCFVTHYNAPRFYSELEKRDSGRFLKLSSIAFGSASVVYIISMLLGVTLFGSNVQSFLLNNLAARDPLALVARTCFGASVLASFPLIFISVRNWFVGLFSSKIKGKEVGIRPVSFVLLSGICLLASAFKDIAFIGALSGGVLGSSMMLIFPPIMYIRALQKKAVKEKSALPLGTIALNLILLAAGITLALLGTINTIISARR